jgi:hypothetical protein
MNPSVNTGLNAKRATSLLPTALLSLLLLLGQAVVAFSQGITVSPAEVEIGTAAMERTVTLNASGFFDLGDVQASQIRIRPGESISDIKIRNATAQRMELSFTVSANAKDGVRALLIKDQKGATVVAVDVRFKLASNVCRPACPTTMVCKNNACEPAPPPPPPHPTCTPNCDPCQKCVAHNVCRDLECRPPCVNAPGQHFACECGKCVPAR